MILNFFKVQSHAAGIVKKPAAMLTTRPQVVVHKSPVVKPAISATAPADDEWEEF